MATPATLGLTVDFPDQRYDAFGRQRNSSPVSLFDASFEYDIPTFTWQTATTQATIAHSNSGTSSTAQVLMTLTASQATASAVLQSRQYFRYQAGKSQQVKITAVVGAGQTAVRKRLGYFNELNGVYFEQNAATDIAFCLRTNTGGSASDTNRVASANWNVDKMDGTGPSGITLDMTKAQVIMFDIAWLGVSRVRCYFVVNGIPYICHQFLNANILAVPYMRHANLPMRYEMTATSGSNAAGTMTPICCAVDSEGGYEYDLGYPCAAFNTADITQNAGNDVHLISIRLKDTFNGTINRALINLNEYGVLVGNVSSIATVLWNTTVTGGSWVSAGAASVVEYNITNTIANGHPIATVFAPASGVQAKGAGAGKIANKLPLSLDIAGTAGSSTVISLVCRATAASTQVMRGYLNWTELR
jgi:hypothetical protein